MQPVNNAADMIAYPKPRIDHLWMMDDRHRRFPKRLIFREINIIARDLPATQLFEKIT